VKGEKFKDLEGVLVIWLQQVNEQNRTVSDEFIRNQ
jgi:hypothetical protein